MSKTLFVGNLPYSMTEDRLRTLFEASGTIVSARIVIDRETQRPKGFGFVEFRGSRTRLRRRSRSCRDA